MDEASHIITIGPADHAAVTHLLPHQITALFGIGRSTLDAWKDEREFPKPVIVNGAAYYSRAEIESWRHSASAPGWLRRGRAKPTSTPAEVFATA